MKTTSAILMVLTGILSAAAAQDWTAWQWEAPVEVPQTGMMRLEVPPPVLDVSRPDLGDLRLRSPGGGETPYLIDLPRHREAGARDAAGFKVVLAGRSTVIEVSPGAADATETVELVSPAREFLKSVSIEGRKGGGGWQPLVTNEVIFRQSSGAERLRLTLPAGVWENLRFTVDDGRSLPVPFTAVRLRVAAEKPPTVELPVTLGGREELPGETRLTLDLGARNLQVAEILLEITDAVFSRSCSLAFSTVMPGGESRPEEAGRGILYRVVGDRESSAEGVVIPLHRRIPSRYLVATFRNADSPPLTITGAGVRSYPTVLAFHAPQAGTYQLLTGNRGASPPEYDLNSLQGTMAAAGGRHLTPGPLKEKADFKIPPSLPGVEPAGAGIDLADWSRRRAVAGAAPGVISLELDAQSLAGSQSGLGDLRLIQDGRQIPYLIKPAPVIRELTPAMNLLPPDPKQPAISRWEITLPVAGLPAFELTATSPDPLFSRRFEASVEHRDELGNPWTESLGTAEWAKSHGQETPLRLPLREQRMPRTFRLLTDHGDNPPILLENPRVRYRAPSIVAKVADGAGLFLVYGNPQATSPRYDLRLVQSELMAAERQSASLGDEEILRPDAAGPKPIDAGSPWLWLALGGVVISLLVVVARLLPRPAAG